MFKLANHKVAGVAMVVGTLIILISPFLAPGTLVDPSSEFSMLDEIADMQEVAGRVHAMALLGMLALLMQIGGLMTIWRATQGDAFGDYLTRFGIFALVISMVMFIFAYALEHMVLHTLGHGTDPQAVNEASAAALNSAKVAIRLIAYYVAWVGAMTLGLGLWSRLSSMGVIKVLSGGVGLLSIAGLLLLVVSSHIHDFASDNPAFEFMAPLIALLEIAWVIALGVGMFRGMPELVVVEDQ